MEAYKKEFIEFMVDCQVLKFGDFVTKSGRKTPFFVNTGFYRTGSQLRKLGAYYAEAINNRFGLDFDVLFGPRESCSAAPFRMEIRSLSSRTSQPQEPPLRRRFPSSRRRAT